MSLVYSLPNRKLLPLKPNGVGSLCRLVLWSGLVGEPAVKKRRDGSMVQNNERIKMLTVKPILTRKGQKKNTSTPTQKQRETRKGDLLPRHKTKSTNWSICRMGLNFVVFYEWQQGSNVTLFLTKAIRRGANGEKIQEAYVANEAAGV